MNDETGNPSVVTGVEIEKTVFPINVKVQESLKEHVFSTDEYKNLERKVGDAEFLSGYKSIMETAAVQIELASLFTDGPQKKEELEKSFSQLNHQGSFGYVGEVLEWANKEDKKDIRSYLKEVYQRKFSDLSNQADKDEIEDSSMEKEYKLAMEAVQIVLKNYPNNQAVQP